MNDLQFIQYVAAGTAVLRALKLTGGTISYGDFAKAIGVWPAGEPWHIRYRDQMLTPILHAMYACSNFGGDNSLDFDCIHNLKGQFGSGYFKTAHIKF
jgi:hypothetical protein